MPRPRICRKVWAHPHVTHFKPAGVPIVRLDESVLSIEELEAIRLKDHEGMSQEQAARKMGISQPTFQRLLNSARKKIADAIVSGKAIRIGGGCHRFMCGRGKRRRCHGGMNGGLHER